METKTAKTEFLALSRICLNNWHYIAKRTLSFHQDINFFTGHSGSGKSTVIDALQIVLYANTDGRGFFNKAAADDSDRSLMEYLRGMVNIGDNNEFSYLRNRDFSTTIVLELKNTGTGQCQCVGVVFDVDTASNTANRRFFWHKGPLWENEYRTGHGPVSIRELEGYLEQHYSREEYFSTSHNERFRRVLYDTYLGGLDQEKFPLLFKRAIPFKMNIRLEDFVKEYICTEQDIHIEDMQESVLQYGRMQRRIEDTCREIRALEQMKEAFSHYSEIQGELSQAAYWAGKMEQLKLKDEIRSLADKGSGAGKDLEQLQLSMKEEEDQIRELTVKSDGLLRQIASTGYEELKNQLRSLNELIERLRASEAGWQKTLLGLKKWEEEDCTSNQTLWDIEEFEHRTISLETLQRLKEDLALTRQDMDKQAQDISARIRELKRLEKQALSELEQLRKGNKAYPRYLEEARDHLRLRLFEKTKKTVQVDVLADLLEVEDEQWRNAVEGYLGNAKLNLVVPPAYAKAALEIYSELDKSRYFSVSVLDTEKAAAADPSPLTGALSEEVRVREDYLRPYVDFLMGKVIKCLSVEELRKQKVGITKDCLLYHNFRLQHMNPEHYTRFAYIGKDSVRKRIRLLEQEIGELSKKMEPLEQGLRECRRIAGLPCLSMEAEEYGSWLKDMESLKVREAEKEALVRKLGSLKEQNVDQLEQERRDVMERCDEKKRGRDQLNLRIRDKEREIESCRSRIRECEQHLAEKERSLPTNEEWDVQLQEYLKQKGNVRYDREREGFLVRCEALSEEKEALFQELVALRGQYLRMYPARNLPLGAQDNEAYDRLLSSLSRDHLEEYRNKARQQARAAVIHFKDDFMYKIRSAIKEALLRKDELNKVISRLDFGKDKYQFVIGRNQGPDGRFYDMFMDEALDIDPSELDHSMDDQMNLFAMERENSYGDLMNELISIFIPPEHASPEQMEEAKRNMERYSDYRTYLSFDMQQLIQNEDGVIRIKLSRMLKKNSGGEGQNPLYVALLASFAQAYHMSAGPKSRPAIRLVVLDEAFSKMDAEKVASCIELIRGLGFQAIISATNDKIQNYVENVDKTFVFANPNKKSISIQEFERSGIELRSLL